LAGLLRDEHKIEGWQAQLPGPARSQGEVPLNPEMISLDRLLWGGFLKELEILKLAHLRTDGPDRKGGFLPALKHCGQRETGHGEDKVDMNGIRDRRFTGPDLQARVHGTAGLLLRKQERSCGDQLDEDGNHRLAAMLQTVLEEGAEIRHVIRSRQHIENVCARPSQSLLKGGVAGGGGGGELLPCSLMAGVQGQASSGFVVTDLTESGACGEGCLSWIPDHHGNEIMADGRAL
jgi:hypothetical protein